MSKLKPAVCALIFNEEGKILGVTRKDNHQAWGLPGGKVEIDAKGRHLETFFSAALREVREETGTHIADAAPIYGDTAEGKYWTLCYLAKVTGELATTEAGLISWVDWDVLLTGPFGSYNQKLKDLFERKNPVIGYNRSKRRVQYSATTFGSNSSATSLTKDLHGWSNPHLNAKVSRFFNNACRQFKEIVSIQGKIDRLAILNLLQADQQRRVHASGWPVDVKETLIACINIQAKKYRKKLLCITKP